MLEFFHFGFRVNFGVLWSSYHSVLGLESMNQERELHMGDMRNINGITYPKARVSIFPLNRAHRLLLLLI